MTYTLVVTSVGPDMALNVTLTDTLPATLDFVSVSGSCVYDVATDRLVCDLGDLAPGETASVTVVTMATADGPLTNMAEVTSEALDPNMADNVAEVTVTVEKGGYTLYLPIIFDSEGVSR